MVEVVQDILDHVTYAGGVGRRRVDAVRGIGAGTPVPGDSDCAVIAEDPSNPTGPRIVRMKDLMFHEVLDKPFDEKEYRMQLEEFAYRGEKIINHVDEKLSEVQQMVVHDVLKRSRQLPYFLRSTNDELRRGHELICKELREVWHMRFEPFFYPSEDDGPISSAYASWPGGWLDLDDMFLTARLLTRYVAELVALIAAAVSQLPDEALDRDQLIAGPPDPALYVLVESFSARVPWIGASLLDDFDIPPSGSSELYDSAPCVYASMTSAPDLQRVKSVDIQAGEGIYKSSPAIMANSPSGNLHAESSVPQHSPLNDAITALNTVLTVHLNHLVSDLHRTMYQTFVRMCTAYVRWKRAFGVEKPQKAQPQKEKPQPEKAYGSESSTPSSTPKASSKRRQSMARAGTQGVLGGRKPSIVSGDSTKASIKRMARRHTLSAIADDNRTESKETDAKARVSLVAEENEGEDTKALDAMD